MKLEDLTLATLAGGAAEEFFQRELAKAVLNIVDVNTDWKKSRSVTLGITIIPTSENRSQAQIQVTAKAGLAPERAATSTAFFGIEDGSVVVREYDPEQMTIGEDREADGEEDDKSTGPRGVVKDKEAVNE